MGYNANYKIRRVGFDVYLTIDNFVICDPELNKTTCISIFSDIIVFPL